MPPVTVHNTQNTRVGIRDGQKKHGQAAGAHSTLTVLTNVDISDRVNQKYDVHDDVNVILELFVCNIL